MPSLQSLDELLALVKNDSTKLLGVTVGSHKITPGQYLAKEEAQVAPKLSFNVTSGTYMVIALDLDAPFPSFKLLGPILHWVQPGLSPSPKDNGVAEFTIGSPFVANYIGPAPPPGSSPHRYAFFLYEQPPGFDGSKYAPADGKNLSNWHRMRYNLEAFEKQAKLGPIIAANYFCSN
ncbi:hypothetical protein BP6252_11548 [Coleophoma cylindrospora]|uniref:Protease inhibitor (Tfs1) n=1 Tax=Coleophoma cylindrospora TaxID=1849047 RepID=A0A3D8QJY1_9HELO|nr:hypothetical protein BP6252_11548 [Coleophoma cylindrospora]